MRLLQPMHGPVTLGDTVEKTAYQIGYINAARELDEWIKEVNLQCWLLMHREANERDDTDKLDKRDD